MVTKEFEMTPQTTKPLKFATTSTISNNFTTSLL